MKTVTDRLRGIQNLIKWIRHKLKSGAYKLCDRQNSIQKESSQFGQLGQSYNKSNWASQNSEQSIQMHDNNEQPILTGPKPNQIDSKRFKIWKLRFLGMDTRHSQSGNL